MEGRKGNYMDLGLLESQIEAHENLEIEETNCLPVDAAGEVESIVRQIEGFLEIHAEVGI